MFEQHTLPISFALALRWAAILPALLSCYAILLLCSAKLPVVAKVLVSGVAWLICSVVFISALFILVAAVGGMANSWPYLIFGMGVFALTCVPGFLVWRKHWLWKLRKVGYFRPRH